ncbi:hypothetical protein SB2_11950 [Methylobacterium radiotolerans]|nr:hypothetical protein SB3_11145 [Methylobacterium radiotolerans]KTS48003.1 hypothetical protein SB2_11950 [Methylobacterium radiotolerans]
MVKRVPVRRWDDQQNAYVETHEHWPSAVVSEVTGQWGLEGHGWRMSFEGDVPEADARRICEAIADQIQFEI